MLQLIKNRIKSYFSLNPIIALCLLIGGVVSCMVAAYAYGNFMPWPSADSPENLQNRYFVMRLESPNNFEQISRFYEYTESQFHLYNFMGQIEFSEKEDPGFVFKNGQPVFSIFFLGETKPPLDPKDHRAEEAYWALLPYNSVFDKRGKLLEVGDKLNINDTEVIFTGYSEYGYVVFSPEFVRDCQSKIRSTDFLSEQLLKPDVIEHYLADLQDKTNLKPYISPLDFISEEKAALPIKMLLIVILLLVSILSYGFLIRYLVDINWRFNAVLLLVGLPVKRLKRLILLEVVTYVLIVGLAGLLLYVPFFTLYLRYHMLYQVVDYNFLDYLLVLFLFSLVSVPLAYSFVNFRAKVTDVDRLMREA